MEALQNGQTTVEGSIEGQSAGAASHAMIEKILSEEPRWQGKGGHTDGQAPSRRMSVLTHLLPLAALRIGSPPLLPSAPQATTSAGRCLPLSPPALQPSIGSSFGALLGELPQTRLALLPSPRCSPHTDVYMCSRTSYGCLCHPVSCECFQWRVVSPYLSASWVISVWALAKEEVSLFIPLLEASAPGPRPPAPPA